MKDLIHQPLEVLLTERSQPSALSGKHFGGRSWLPRASVLSWGSWQCDLLMPGYKVIVSLPHLEITLKGHLNFRAPQRVCIAVVETTLQPNFSLCLVSKGEDNCLYFQVFISRALPNKFPAC